MSDRIVKVPGMRRQCCVSGCEDSFDCKDANGNGFCAEHYKKYGLTDSDGGSSTPINDLRWSIEPTKDDDSLL